MPPKAQDNCGKPAVSSSSIFADVSEPDEVKEQKPANDVASTGQIVRTSSSPSASESDAGPPPTSIKFQASGSVCDPSVSDAKRLYFKKRSRSLAIDRPPAAFLLSKCRRTDLRESAKRSGNTGEDLDDSVDGEERATLGTGSQDLIRTGEHDGVTKIKLVRNDKSGLAKKEPGSSGEEADIDSSSGGSGTGECASRRAHKLRAAIVCKDGHVPPQGPQYEGDCMVASRLLQLWTALPVIQQYGDIVQQDIPFETAQHERIAVPC